METEAHLEGSRSRTVFLRTACVMPRQLLGLRNTKTQWKTGKRLEYTLGDTQSSEGRGGRSSTVTGQLHHSYTSTYLLLSLKHGKGSHCQVLVETQHLKLSVVGKEYTRPHLESSLVWLCFKINLYFKTI